jgi:hypothetical protein
MAKLKEKVVRAELKRLEPAAKEVSQIFELALKSTGAKKVRCTIGAPI